MNCPPTAPHPSLIAFEPAAVRNMTVFGAPAQAVLVPGRKARRDQANGARPPFGRSPVPRILEEEAWWHDDDFALTPNKFPFAREQRLLWPRRARREPDAVMWTAACTWSHVSGGTAMVNTIGAAATIAWAHVHLTPEQLPFLGTIPEHEGPRGLVDLPAGVELVQKDLPCCVLGVRGGSIETRGEALAELMAVRLTPAWNVCMHGETAWLFPRRVETPAPHFPFALGAAELWGRWCYVDEEPFATATGETLERALTDAGSPAMPR